MASKMLDTLEPAFKLKVEKLIADAKIHGINLAPTSCRRTIAQQDKLYAQGRTTKGDIVTKAKGGQSPHNFGLACDLCPLDKNGNLWWDAPDDVWHVIHNLAEGEGMLDSGRKTAALDSGYDWNFKDSPHVEDPHWKEAQALWKEGKLYVA